MLLRSRWGVVLALSLTMACLHLVPGFTNILEYQFAQFWSQPWRIFTTHLVHLDRAHLGTNLISFICTVIIFAPVFTCGRLCFALVVSASGASLFTYFSGQTLPFIGFSAVTYGLLSFAAFGVIYHQCPDIRRPIGYLMLVGLAFKSYFEFTQFDFTAHWLGVHIAYIAHAGGVIGGALAFYVHQVASRLKSNLVHKKSAT